MYAVIIKGIPGQSDLVYGPFDTSQDAVDFTDRHPAPATIVTLLDPSA